MSPSSGAAKHFIIQKKHTKKFSICDGFLDPSRVWREEKTRQPQKVKPTHGVAEPFVTSQRAELNWNWINFWNIFPDRSCCTRLLYIWRATTSDSVENKASCLWGDSYLCCCCLGVLRRPDVTLMQKPIKQRLKINKTPSESSDCSLCGGISGPVATTCSVSMCA